MALKLGTLTVDINANTKGLKKGEREVKRTGDSMKKSFKGVGAAIAVAFSAETLRRLAIAADNMQILERRLVRFTGSTKAAGQTFEALTKIASDTGQEIGTTISIFERFSLIRNDIGATNSEIIQMVETVQKLGAIGGSSATEISNALRQLSQGLAGGVLRAEEFNSIVENTPEIARAIGREMGLGMGELRKAMLDGEVTSQAVFEALQRAADDTNKKFEELPKSIGMVTQAIQNNLLVTLKALDEEFGLSTGLSEFLQKVNDLIEATNQLNFTEQGENLKKINALMEEQAGLQTEVAAKLEIINDWHGKAHGETVQKNLQKDIDLRRSRIKEIDREIMALTKQREEILKPADEAEEKKKKTVTPLDPAEANKALIQQLKEQQKALELRAQLFKDSDAEIEAEILDFQIRALGLYHQGSEEILQVEQALNDRRVEKWDEASQKIIDAKQEENRRLKELEESQRMATLTAAGDIFGALASVAGSFEGEQSKTYDRLFRLQKGFAIASATLAMGQNISEASKTGFPENLPLIAAAARQGAQILSQIQGAQFGGGRQFGGTASSILAHPINESGAPEILQQAGRQYLLPNGKSGKISPMEETGGSGKNISVSIISNGEPQVITGQSVSENQVAIMIDNANKQLESKINTSLATGRGETFKSLTQGARVERNVRG